MILYSNAHRNGKNTITSLVENEPVDDLILDVQVYFIPLVVNTAKCVVESLVIK